MCAAIKEIPQLAPGWGCCACRTYNGEQRLAYKYCGKTRCNPKKMN